MPSAYPKRSWGRQPVFRQMAVVIISALLPYILRILFSSPSENLIPLHITFFAALIISALSVIITRGFERYPGTEAVSAIIPTFSIMYALLMAGLLVARLDYARGMLFGNFALCIILLFVQQLVWPTKRRLRMALIEGGAARPIPRGDIDWIPVTDPTFEFADIDAVTVDLRADLSDAWERCITELALANVPVYHIKHLRESLSGQLELEHLSETSYGTLSPPGSYLAAKRALDAAAALTALLLLWPIMAVVAAAVKIDSTGPAVFRQPRVGFRGRVFVVYKFRTMHTSGGVPDERNAAMTRKDDPRITRIGKFLRKSRLDELPQLLNVIRGEMSLIGPRPEAEVLSKWYEQEIPFYRYRHIVRPGVTGWAQINQGHVTDVNDVAAKLNYDFYYIKHLSPWIDALIAVRTLVIMFSGRGAK